MGSEEVEKVWGVLREGHMEEIRLARDSLFGYGSRLYVVCGTPSRGEAPHPLSMSKEPGAERTGGQRQRGKISHPSLSVSFWSDRVADCRKMFEHLVE